MGFRDFWNRLTGGDKVERIEERLREEKAEQPAQVDDYEAMKDDVVIEERYPGGERTDLDSDEPPESQKW